MKNKQPISKPSATVAALRSPGGKSGFTLVELLVTISIIAIMAGLFLAGLQSTVDSGRIAATKATIAKINNLVMQRYESYRQRRVPITIVVTPTGVDANGASGLTNVSSTTPQILAAGWRLDALRELMRCELPDHWSDIVVQSSGLANNPVGYPNGTAAAGRPCLTPPSLLQAYFRKFNAITTANHSAGRTPTGTPAWSSNANSPSTSYEGAECLYLICTTGISDEMDAQEQFRPNEVGDFDGDGALEFLDAWGHPIAFLRWAPGFRSELQTQVDPDPFDPRHVYASAYPSPTGTAASAYPPASTQKVVATYGNGTFALYPLIMSAGPDGYLDIVTKYGAELAVSAGNNDPFYSSTSAFSGGVSGYIGPYGTIADVDGPGSAPDGVLENADNITNHLMGTK